MNNFKLGNEFITSIQSFLQGNSLLSYPYLSQPTFLFVFNNEFKNYSISNNFLNSNSTLQSSLNSYNNRSNALQMELNQQIQNLSNFSSYVDKVFNQLYLSLSNISSTSNDQRISSEKSDRNTDNTISQSQFQINPNLCRKQTTKEPLNQENKTQELNPFDNASNTSSKNIQARKKLKIKKFVCQYQDCGKKFEYKWILDRHTNSHFCFRLFKCQCCEKSYKSKENLSLHFKNKHLGLKPYPCDFCGAKFSHRNGN